ncbi:MAG: class I SAM-dependent methyltransferase [Colwellia sp.]|nr:class I SAM-dependent methyltransferase [Colwellia sp.]
MPNDHWNADDYVTHAGYVSALTQVVMQDLAPKMGEAVLDLGCGDGELAAAMIKAGCDVIGVDSSANLVAAACARGVDAHVGDAQEINYCALFDAVFSNAALHWMPKQDQIAARSFKALKGGGRFVGEMGGDGNIACIRTAMTTALAEMAIDFSARDPWVFPNVDEQTARLEQAGFMVRKCVLRARPTELPTDVRGWFETYSNEILSDLTEAQRDTVINRMVELCRPDLCGPNGKWTVDYVRLNFVAVKP